MAETNVESLQHVLNTERILVQTIQTVNSPGPIAEHIDTVIEALGVYFESDRAYLFNYDNERSVLSKTYKWYKKRNTTKKDFLQDIDVHYIERWRSFFEKKQCLVVLDIEEIKTSKPDEYAIMKKQDIRSYVEAPLFQNNNFIGFIGLDNPSREKIRYIGDSLRSLAYSISNAMKREQNAIQREKVTQKERNLRAIYETSIENVELFLWTFDIPNRTITLMDNAYTKRRSKELQLPHEIKNVPEYFKKYMDDENFAIFKEMYDDIFAGKQKVSCTIKVFSETSNKKNLFVLKIQHTVICDANGVPLKAYGSTQNLTRQWADNEKYRQELSIYNGQDEKDLVAKGHFNLSLNKIISYSQISTLALDLSLYTTYDEAFSILGKNPSRPEEQKQLCSILNRTELIDYFKNGKSIFSFTYYRVSKEDSSAWVKIELHTFEEPVSGNIECFLYTHNVTKQHLEEMIVVRLTELDYDYIGLINTQTKMFTYFKAGTELIQDQLLKQVPYEDCFNEIIHTSVTESEQSDIRANMDFVKISEELSKESLYQFSYSTESDGKPQRKMFKYCYLDESKRQIFFCISDITGQFLQEQDQMQKMQAALREAEQADHAKTEFISRISHDIRTPISIIKNMTEFAIADRNNEDTLLHDLSKIKTANEFLLSLINDVLDISKIDSGKIELHPAPYTFEDHNANIKNILEPMCEDKGLKCIVERRRKTGTIVADKVRLNQIVLNIISNAVKYTEPGGTVTYISDSTNLPDNKIRWGFEIKDTGIGMSEEFQKKMFEPFTQEYDNPLRAKGITGTGLGLSIVKKMVDLMGGILEVESERGKGTTVRCHIVFPDAERDPAYAEQKVTKPKKTSSEKNQLAGTVLLVEDNEINLEIAKRILEEIGFTVDSAENGAKAVTKFIKSQLNYYRIIFMDIQMPIMNGYEATETIRSLERKDAKEIPIIAMTADAFADAMEHGKKVGMNENVVQPIDPSNLLAAIENELQN